MKWYMYDIDELTEAEYQKWLSYMSPDKRARIDSFRSMDDKKRSVAAEMLVRKAISEENSIDAAQIVICTDKNGKPYARNVKTQFSAGHSEKLAVCAVSEHPIGIDVEKIRPISIKLAEKFFSQDEKERLFSGICSPFFSYTEDKTILERFFRIWTCKEAYAKYTGEGLADIKKSFDYGRTKSHVVGEYIISIYE